MPTTRSGNSYAMTSTHNRNNPNTTNPNPIHSIPTNHAPINQTQPNINPTLQDPNNSTSSHQHPNTENPNTRESDQPKLQYQLDQIATVMAQVMRRLDVMEERYAREEYILPNQQGRRVDHRGRLNNVDEEDVHETEEEIHELYDHDHQVRHHRQAGYRGQIVHQPPLDELTKRMKIDVPDFLSKLEPNAFEDWLTAIEDYFDWFTVSEDRKVRYVRMKLKGHARAWWGSVEEQLRRKRRPPISNWEEMKERLKEKYLPIDYEQMMFEEMLQLRQGSLSVDQFTDRFHELSVRSRVVETEQQTLARYRTGLRSDLRKDMWIARLINVEEAYQLALRLEKQAGSVTGRRVATWDAKPEFASASAAHKNPALRDQPRSGVNGDFKGKAKVSNEGPQCYKCKGFGHYAVVCPTRDRKCKHLNKKKKSKNRFININTRRREGVGIFFLHLHLHLLSSSLCQPNSFLFFS